jgi:hypothetical protein
MGKLGAPLLLSSETVIISFIRIILHCGLPDIERQNKIKFIPQLRIHRLYQGGNVTLYQVTGRLYPREVALLQEASGFCHRGLHYRAAFIGASFVGSSKCI